MDDLNHGGTTASAPRPDSLGVDTSGDKTPPPKVENAAQKNSIDLSPREIFKKVVANDAKQNKRLWAKYKIPDKTSNGTGRSSESPEYSKGSSRMRFIVCTLGLMSLAMSQMSRMVINQSITQMVQPSMRAATGEDPLKSASGVSDGSCPWPTDDEDLTQPLTTPASLPPPATTTITEAIMTTTLTPTTTTSIVTPLTTTATIPIKTTTWESPTSSQISLSSISTEPGEFRASSVSESTSGRMIPDQRPTPAASLATPAGELDDNLEELPDVFDTVLNDDDQGAESTAALKNLTNMSSKDLMYDRFEWSMKQQNIILGGFYYSYFAFMILGGRLAEVYGAKYVILLSVAGSALINLATPWMARTSFALLVMSRVVMGAIQSGVFPAMYALIAKWLTMSEASIFAPLIKMNLRLGMVLGSLIPGVISGWPNVFYFTGVVSALWSLAWIFIATSDPADSRWVSAGELRHINRKKRAGREQQQQQAKEEIELAEAEGGQFREAAHERRPNRGEPLKKRSLKTPWLKIWTSPSVLGLIIVKLTFNYALDFLAIELPSYLKYVHHASRQKISAITTPMFGIQVFLIVFVGWLAKVVVQRRPLGMSKTSIRKLFQGVASFGLAFTFLLLTFNDCNLTFVAILLQLVSLLSMFTAGGETMLPYDLSEDYPATIMSIANSIANLSGVTTTTLAGFILGDQGGSYYRWNILIYLIAGANLLGGLAFTCLVSAEPIDFETRSSDIESGAKTSEEDTTEIKLDDAPKSEVAGELGAKEPIKE